jgi:hypothetical protein
MNNWISAPENQVLVVVSTTAVAGIVLLAAEFLVVKANRADRANNLGTESSPRYLGALRVLLGYCPWPRGTSSTVSTCSAYPS